MFNSKMKRLSLVRGVLALIMISFVYGHNGVSHDTSDPDYFNGDPFTGRCVSCVTYKALYCLN